MKISKRSWHYKFLDRYSGTSMWRRNWSLCSYFWILFFWLALYTALVSGVLFIAGAVVWVFILNPLGALLTLLAILGGVGLAMGLLYVISRLILRNDQEGHILPAYLKARKDKICPLIEFEETA